MHQFIGLGEKVPFLFSYHLFTVFVLSLICCSLVDINPSLHYLLDTPRPSRLSFPFYTSQELQLDLTMSLLFLLAQIYGMESQVYICRSSQHSNYVLVS